MNGHIVACRYGREIKGFQLRTDGRSWHFAVKSLGGTEAARAAALAEASRQGLTLKTYGKRSGDGITWQWRAARTGRPVLYVIVSFVAPDGKRHITGYSTERHGLSGALDMAVFARTSAGHVVTYRNEILAALQAEYETRGTR